MSMNMHPAIRELLPWVAVVPAPGPTEGNHALTALTGSVLTLLLGLVFLTGLLMDALWHIHYVVGFILIPVVALKLMSTGYRMLRYYTGSSPYRAAGPPDPVSRLSAPFLVLSVVVALVTGVALFIERSRGGPLSTLHTDAAVISALLLGVHLLAHLPDAIVTSWREARALWARAIAVRIGAVLMALIIGIGLGTATYRLGVWPPRPREDGAGRIRSDVRARISWDTVVAALPRIEEA
jgi:hypothetical protein